MDDKKAIDIKILLKIAKEAGDRILEVYNNPGTAHVVDYKSDDSPLTLADRASHAVITKALPQYFPTIPVLSEEDQEVVDYNTRKLWPVYWLIDPLDGTKEFISRNGEFTVNIALIEDQKPKMGVIYVPVTDTFYYGNREGAFKKSGLHGNSNRLKVNNKTADRIAVRSKSHASPEEDEVLSRFGVVNFISVGSSLKFCMVAEGKADLYYRHGPTMEWDTAAGQAILHAAGGKVFEGSDTVKEFAYNKENLLNGSFLCVGFQYNT